MQETVIIKAVRNLAVLQDSLGSLVEKHPDLNVAAVLHSPVSADTFILWMF